MTAPGDTKPSLARRVWRAVVLDIRPLRIPAYRRLWISTLITGFGSQLTVVAVPKQLFDITGSSAYVGLSGAVALVPLLIFGIWGGAIADAMDRRKLLILANAGIAAVSGFLWLQAFLELNSVWVVLVLLAFNQALFGINMPTRGAVIARLVPAELRPAAAALGGSVGVFAAVLGPMAAGVLLPFMGIATLYFLDTIALTAVMYAVWRLPALPPLNGGSQKAGIRDVFQGFAYMAAQKVLLASFVVDVIAMVAGMPRALFPEMAERTFGDPTGGGLALGLLFAAIPAGGFVASLLSGWVSRVRRQGVAVTLAIAVWGVAMVGFGLSGWLWLAVVFLAIGGMADMVSSIYRQAILQTAATDEMRGRMQGAFIVVVAGGPRLADMLHGWGGAQFGTAVTTATGGALVVVGVIVAVFLLPAFWRYRAPISSDTGESQSM